MKPESLLLPQNFQEDCDLNGWLPQAAGPGVLSGRRGVSEK